MGYVDPTALDALIDTYETSIGSSPRSCTPTVCG
jgi:hypothetical protein